MLVEKHIMSSDFQSVMRKEKKVDRVNYINTFITMKN